MAACRVTCQPSKVLPFYMYVVLMDLACPKCTPTKAANPASEADLPRAPLGSHAEYLEFCRCPLDEDGHRCWREMLVTLGVSNPDAWMRYAAKYATLPPLPAQLALPAPVWSFVSLTMLLYLQPVLLAALAERMQWTREPSPCTEIAMNFAGFRAKSYTAIAWKLITGHCVSTSSYPTAPAQPRWKP